MKLISLTHVKSRSSKIRFGGPDGGDGGSGGSMILLADSHLRDLRALQTHYRGDHGEHGRGSYHTGKCGKDVLIKVLFASRVY